MSIRKHLFQCLAGLLLAGVAVSGRAAVEIEGFQVEESIVEGGVKLVLNGTAVHKRGYFKTELAALYMPERVHTAEAVYKTNGVRVLRRVILRDVPMASASRYFVNDFKLAATEAEFKQLINEIGDLGGIYGTITKVSRGDMVDTVWTPGKGMTGRYNGRQLGDRATKNDLFWQVYMRMYVGQAAQENFRNGLLGIAAKE